MTFDLLSLAIEVPLAVAYLAFAVYAVGHLSQPTESYYSRAIGQTFQDTRPDELPASALSHGLQNLPSSNPKQQKRKNTAIEVIRLLPAS
jgi:hypothetical protein